MASSSLRPTLYAVLFCVGCAPTTSKTSAKVLPLKRLRIYETGVGYFERSGKLEGTQRTALPVPAGHVDDALKTLTVVAEGGQAKIAGVSFPSNLSGAMARALSGLSPKGNGPLSFEDVLWGMRGQLLELKLATGTITGAVIGIKKRRVGTKRSGARAVQQTRLESVLLVLQKSGAVRRVSMPDVQSIRPRSAALRERMNTALTALTKNGRLKARALSLLSSANGPITLGYIAETPLFRVSYRLVASAAQKRQTLRGWALVHNDSDEDWREVQVSLVSGRPDSFLFPLAVPRYSRRPLLHPKRALPSVPQLINTTPDMMWGDQLSGDAIGENYGSGGLGLSGLSGTGGGGRGFGRGYGKIGRIGSLESPSLKVGNLAGFSKAKTKKTGTLFRYRMDQPLALAAHSSALLPFTQAAIAAEKITLVEDYGQKARASILLENSTNQTLPAGTIAFYADGIFVGESFLPRTKPQARHFLEHGTDLDVKVDNVRQHEKATTKKLERDFVGTRLVEHYLRRRNVTVSLKNLDSAPRRVFLRIKAVLNAKVTGSDAMDFDRDKKRAYAIFQLAPTSKAQRTLTISEGLKRHIELTHASLHMLRRLQKLSFLRADQRTALGEIVAKRAARQKQDQQVVIAKRARRRMLETLARFRKHLAAIGGKDKAGVGPFVKRVLATEDALEKNQAQLDTLERQRQAFDRELKALARKCAALFDMRS